MLPPSPPPGPPLWHLNLLGAPPSALPALLLRLFLATNGADAAPAADAGTHANPCAHNTGANTGTHIILAHIIAHADPGAHNTGADALRTSTALMQPAALPRPPARLTD